MTTWTGGETPVSVRIGPLGWIVFGLRSLICGLTILFGLAAMWVLRRLGRTQAARGVPRVACRFMLAVIGLRCRVTGRAMTHRGAVVANHAGWVDILTLRAFQDVTFVSKDDVANWPGIGAMARIVGTIFIRRDPKLAAAQQAELAGHIKNGERILVFPEGTSTDGCRVLPFKSTLFQTFFDPDLAGVWVQPVTVVYTAPEGQDPRFYGWWGDMDFGPHFMRVLASLRRGRVDIVFHEPLSVADFPSRKALATAAENAVRGGMNQVLSR